MTLRIECPGCQQSFEVSEELEGRTVECGSCENRFQVTAEVMATTRDRFYPDEIKKEVDLSRFGRAPATSAPVEFRTMEYEKSGKQLFVGPVPPVRMFAAVGGLLIVVVTALAFYFGSLPTSSILQDIERADRYMIAGFMGLMAGGLLIWGMVRNRVAGAFLALLGIAGMLALAHYLPVYRTINVDAKLQSRALDASESEEEKTEEEKPGFFPGITEELYTPEEVMKKTRWKAAVLPLVSEGDDTHVVAIWVRTMHEFHRLQIQGYLKQEFSLAARPDFRVLRDGGLFVMSGIPFDLDRVEVAVERFGEIEQVIPELRLIQMQVNSTVLGEVSNKLTGKLNDPEDGAFYSLNYAELIALDRERVKDAIRRLTLAEPIRMRKDITVRLVGLLRGEYDEETLGNLAKALKIWSEPGDGADRIVTDLGLKMITQGKTVPDEILQFLAERKTPEAAALLVSLWAEDSTARQRFLEEYGSQAAPRLVDYLGSDDVGLSRSAARLLGKIGTKQQVEEMKKVLASSQDSEFKLILQDAITRCASR